jgi:hypothetical protein
MTGPQTDTGVSGALTDGTGISTFTLPKIVKDALLDFLLTAPATFALLNVANVEGALQAPVAVGLGLLDAAIRVLYRAALKALQSP